MGRIIDLLTLYKYLHTERRTSEIMKKEYAIRTLEELFLLGFLCFY